MGGWNPVCGACSASAAKCHRCAIPICGFHGAVGPRQIMHRPMLDFAAFQATEFPVANPPATAPTCIACQIAEAQFDLLGVSGFPVGSNEYNQLRLIGDLRESGTAVMADHQLAATGLTRGLDHIWPEFFVPIMRPAFLAVTMLQLMACWSFGDWDRGHWIARVLVYFAASAAVAAGTPTLLYLPTRLLLARAAARDGIVPPAGAAPMQHPMNWPGPAWVVTIIGQAFLILWAVPRWLLDSRVANDHTMALVVQLAVVVAYVVAAQLVIDRKRRERDNRLQLRDGATRTLAYAEADLLAIRCGHVGCQLCAALDQT